MSTALNPAQYVTQANVTENYPSVTIKHPSGKSSVSIYLSGATVHSWKILDTELLFVSDKSVRAAGKALRGGIPVVFRKYINGTHTTNTEHATHDDSTNLWFIPSSRDDE